MWGELGEAEGEESLDAEKIFSARRTPSKQTLYSGCVQGKTSEDEPTKGGRKRERHRNEK